MSKRMNWTYSLIEDENRFIVSDETNQIAAITGSRGYFETNARLIAAAPDLLRACRMILGRLDLEAREQGEDAVFIGNALRSTLREAIQKATDGINIIEKRRN